MNLAHLKTITYGGGPMYVADLRRALEMWGPRLYQLFAQGEAPMTVTGLSQRHHAMVDHPRYDDWLASVGFPRTGVEVRVVDENDVDLPPGEPGEILARGDIVMAGYWRNPEATAETLRGGWLHMGDAGTLDATGFITLKDRIKDMIISGGSNIYPARDRGGAAAPRGGAGGVGGRPPAPGVGRGGGGVRRRARGDARRGLPRSIVSAWTTSPASSGRGATCASKSLPKNNYGKVLKTALRERLAAQGEALMRDVSIIGVGSTRFGRHDEAGHRRPGRGRRT